MNNKKGFTLVEMLAVIVLIAVLSVVAVSTYRGINESSKKKTLEAKIEQIESAAEKWARENNITSKMTISVNTLVVEGYITADDVGTDGLAVIKNPVTAENMICNVVELSFKEGLINSHFNGNVQNCKLAVQSLEDSKIDILVKSSSNERLSGTSSIAKWTNEDVVLIVNSTDYDPKATSISYDFEGSTITKNKDTLTKYTGTNFITEEVAKNYYNVYYVHSELLMDSKIVVTYDIPGEGTKSTAYTIRFDQEEAAATLKTNSEWLTSDAKAEITVDDGKGSGPAGIYMSQDDKIFEESSFIEAKPSITLENLDVGRYYIWTLDNAGNKSKKYKMILDINNLDDSEPACKVNFHGTLGNNGWFKEDPVTPGGETTKPAGISGNNVGVNMEENNPVYTAFAKYQTTIEGLGEVREDNTPKEGTPYYCHVKTLSGKYDNASETLYLDRTPPTLNIVVDRPNTHEQHKTVHVTIRDTLSGLNPSTTVRYGLSMSNTNPPANNAWTDINITTSAQNNAAVIKDFTTTELVTGTWYLWIDASAFTDWAGNKPEGNQNGTTYVFGPYKFDNTAPVCDGVGGKTNWTNTTYTVNQYCLDNKDTNDQSGCETRFFSKSYTVAQNYQTDTIVIRDKAGNTTTCPTNVYLEHIQPTCSFTESGPDGSNGWYVGNAVVTLHYGDTGSPQSGISTWGAAKTQNSTNKSTTVTFTENGARLTAYGYVRDVAGNSNTCSITVKKDDASEAQAAGCKNILGNSTWTDTGPISYGLELKTHPVSGCREGTDEAGSVWNSSCQDIMSTNHDAKTHTTNATVYFFSNSGVGITCPYGTHNIYLDTVDPDCSIHGDNDYSADGVTVSMWCGDDLSGCTQETTKWYGRKYSESFYVYDRAGNSCHRRIQIDGIDCYHWVQTSCSYAPDESTEYSADYDKEVCEPCTWAACQNNYWCCHYRYTSYRCYYSPS